MGAISVDQFLADPESLLSQAQRGEITVVTQSSKPLFMAVPMGAAVNAPAVHLELAVSLFDREQVSLGVAARIAGLAISEMIDQLGRRKISVVRYAPGEFAEEMKFIRDLPERR